MEDVLNCQHSMASVLGWFANPIHGDGDYPEYMRTMVGMPVLSEAEKEEVRGTADFFAFSFGPNNFRPSNMVSAVKMGQNVSLNLRQVLNWIKLEYDNPRILISENGWFTESYIKTEDTTAIYMMKNFLNQVLQGWLHFGSVCNKFMCICVCLCECISRAHTCFRRPDEAVRWHGVGVVEQIQVLRKSCEHLQLLSYSLRPQFRGFV